MLERQSLKCCWESWTATYKTTKLDHSLIPNKKKISKCIKDLNVRPDFKKTHRGKHRQKKPINKRAEDLNTIAKIWIQHKYPLTKEWIKKMVHIYNEILLGH